MISSQDRTIASLKYLIAHLKQQVASTETRINVLAENARSAVLVKNRVSALAALRSRRAAEIILTQRLDTLSGLEAVFDKIEQAVDQVTMVRVIEASTGVLQNLNAEVGGTTSVEEVVDKLREEMDEMDKIGDAIKSTRQGDVVIDDGAIDDELEAIVQQNKLKSAEKEALQTQERLANTAASIDTEAASRLPEQSIRPESALPKAPTVPSLETLAVNAIDRMSLDERQRPYLESIHDDERVVLLPSGV